MPSWPPSGSGRSPPGSSAGWPVRPPPTDAPGSWRPGARRPPPSSSTSAPTGWCWGRRARPADGGWSTSTDPSGRCSPSSAVPIRPGADTVAARLALVAAGRRVAADGLAPGGTGALAERVADVVVATPRGTRLAELGPAELAVVGLDGTHLDGPPPAPDVMLLLAALRALPDARAAALVAPTASVALSTRADVDPADALPPLTVAGAALGPVALVPPPVPGDEAAVVEAVTAVASRHRLVLVAHHGLIAADAGFDEVLDRLAGFEAAAAVLVALGEARRRHLTPDQVARLRSGEADPSEQRRRG